MSMNEQYQEQEQEQPMPGTVSMSSTTGITKPVTRKRGMHVNPQFVPSVCVQSLSNFT